MTPERRTVTSDWVFLCALGPTFALKTLHWLACQSHFAF
jgi:hypothetical protein